MKICKDCKILKPLSEFYKHRSHKDGHINFCNSCYYKRHRENNIKAVIKLSSRNKKIIDEYLQSHPCIDCGESDFEVLDFDHVRGKKITNVSEMLTYSEEKLLNEIAKCDIVCANCHRRRTNRSSKRGRPRKE